MPRVSHSTRNRTTSTSTRFTSRRSSTTASPSDSSMLRRRSARCSEAIRPLRASVVVPESVERVTLSIEIGGGCRHANGKRYAVRKLLSEFNSPGNHAKPRECTREISRPWFQRQRGPRMRDVQDDTDLEPSEETFRLIVETIPGLIAVMTPIGELEHV